MITNIVFRKLIAEKKENIKPPFKAGLKLDIKDIQKETSLKLVNERVLLKISFVYELNYQPNQAKISIEGDVLYLTDSKESKKILDDWKNKNLETNFRLYVLNSVFLKCNLKSLALEEEFNLPPHVNLPRIQANKEELGKKEEKKEEKKANPGYTN